ncbi:hypothetical protein C7416_103579 [Cupriavidus phytorum]|uniref:Uncharacterized protein n=1 Tax=Cupriavidus phytorum TaxID=3024399 RepID=A0A2W7P6P8_9BURK|nr:hypothetical protein [Cupriavidus alkaliphilus]PZX30846.1 hypothetical protein C7416_103579 [Cupriavidus alkaliphilus]
MCEPNSLCFELLKGAPAAAVALVIGAIAGYVAWRQYAVAKAKLNFDLFAKRLAIYDATIFFIERGGENLHNPAPYCINFNNDTAAAKFLFGPEVATYIENVRKTYFDMARMHQNLKPGDPEGAVKEITKKDEWLRAQLTDAKAVFGKYLDFSKWP